MGKSGREHGKKRKYYIEEVDLIEENLDSIVSYSQELGITNLDYGSVKQDGAFICLYFTHNLQNYRVENCIDGDRNGYLIYHQSSAGSKGYRKNNYHKERVFYSHYVMLKWISTRHSMKKSERTINYKNKNSHSIENLFDQIKK